ncbi:hypothetical protein L3X38_034469 [Prunus dulcis]|uniref:Transmembrane protein n=1 Tax=Prunus dulcis TaxID=3755 RepID=A0AAD4VHW4_PRUDU|nr:hypothetical protein L3X38_034469 [Prunus dulcis]
MAVISSTKSSPAAVGALGLVLCDRVLQAGIFACFCFVWKTKAHPTAPPRHPIVQTFLWLQIKMGYVVVVSVPVILFIVIIALAFYLIGRANGRREAVSAQQHFGPPVPPPLQAQEKSDQV